MKNKRAGLILRLYKTNYILLAHAYGKSLPNNVYDIPKGHCEKNEMLEQAMIREVKEETNIDIDPLEVVFIGDFEYENDTLALFYCEKDFDIKDCKCKSFFINKRGEKVPEVISYKLFNFVNEDLNESHIYKSLRKILEKVFMVIPRY